MVQLVKYEAARYALQEARSVDEVKDVKDKAEALRLYARQAHDKDMEIWTAEIKLRAVRRLGELSAALEKSGGGANPIRSGTYGRSSGAHPRNSVQPPQPPRAVFQIFNAIRCLTLPRSAPGLWVLPQCCVSILRPSTDV